MVALRVLDLTIDVPEAVAPDLDGFARTTEPAVLSIAATELDLAVAELTRVAVEHSGLLCAHAAVVSGPAGGLLVVPGASGLGKTTLTAALVRAGFSYVSDEMLAVDRTSGRAFPFPRPLGLAAEVWPVLGLPGDPPPHGTERFFPPSQFGRLERAGGAITDIVLARREPGPPSVRPASSRGPAVASLLTRAFNHYRDPAGSFRTVVAVVRAARVWCARYESAPELADLLATTGGPDQAESATAAR